jgi:hypothetical protein
MKMPHLLRVDHSASQFASLIVATQEAGMRVGWLDLENLNPAPESLEAAAELGVLRAVSVAVGRTVAVKSLRGTPVVKDLLREHFRGCQLVLVLGAIEAPHLTSDGEAWSVHAADAMAFNWTTDELVARLRKAKPFG